MITVIVLAGLLGMFHNLQYHKGTIHYDSMTAKAYLANFLRLENSVDFYFNLETIPTEEAFEGRYEAVPMIRFDTYHLAEKYEKRFNQFKSKNGVETINFHIDFDDMEAIRNLPYPLQYYSDDLVNQKAFSGEYSLELTPEDQFSVELIIDDLEEGDRISVSAWKYGEGFDGHLVIASEQNFYREIKVHHKKDRGWKKMSLHTYIPDNLPDDKLKIYFWNSGKNTIYFDDLSFTIEKIKRQDP